MDLERKLTEPEIRALIDTKLDDTRTWPEVLHAHVAIKQSAATGLEDWASYRRDLLRNLVERQAEILVHWAHVNILVDALEQRATPDGLTRHVAIELSNNICFLVCETMDACFDMAERARKVLPWKSQEELDAALGETHESTSQGAEPVS